MKPPASPQALEEFARQQTNDPKGRGIARACWKVIDALHAQEEPKEEAVRSASPQIDQYLEALSHDTRNRLNIGQSCLDPRCSSCLREYGILQAAIREAFKLGVSEAERAAQNDVQLGASRQELYDLGLAAGRQEQTENASKFSLAAPMENPRCEGCGGPHPFDTSLPSVVWNERIRYEGLPDYLCANCILRVFAREGESFTATLYGADLHGVPIEVKVDGNTARDADRIQQENNDLRYEPRGPASSRAGRAGGARRGSAAKRARTVRFTSEAHGVQHCAYLSGAWMQRGDERVSARFGVRPWTM